MGPPGAGRGRRRSCSGASRRAAHLDGRHPARRGQAEDGARARRRSGYMDRGELVPDDVVIGVVEERLRATGLRARVHPRRLPAHGGAGGGARRRCSAQRGGSLDACGQPRGAAATSWSSGSRGGARAATAARCSTSIFEPPTNAGLCDRCSGELYQRDDDREDIIGARLEVYERADGAAARATTGGTGCCVEVDGIGEPRRRLSGASSSGWRSRSDDRAQGAGRDRDACARRA